MRHHGMTLAAGLVLMMGTALAASAETVLHSFAGGTDGSYPAAGVIDQAGNIYGTTRYGGPNGDGTVFKLTQSGGVWTETVIYSFAGANAGSSPAASVVMDAAGNLYGTTRLGGPANAGTVFRLSPAGSSWTETVLYAFTGGTDGGAPQAALTLHGKAIYGTTPQGGAAGNGTVFELKQVNGSWQERVLYSFAGGNNDGAYAYCQPVFDKLGNMYGTTASGGPEPSLNCSLRAKPGRKPSRTSSRETLMEAMWTMVSSWMPPAISTVLLYPVASTRRERRMS